MAWDDGDFMALVTEARDGDQRAWASLVEAFGPLVSAYVHAATFDDPDAAVGRIFEEVARGIDCFEGDRDEFLVYLFDVAVGQRRAQPARLSLVRDGGALPSGLATAHPDLRDAVLLARIAGLAPADIAEILEVDAPTVVEWHRQGLGLLDR